MAALWFLDYLFVLWPCFSRLKEMNIGFFGAVVASKLLFENVEISIRDVGANGFSMLDMKA